MVIFSIILFSLLGPLPIQWRIISRLVFILPLTSVSYEYIRWSSKHLSNPIVAVLISPNLWLQKITTAEPTLEMIDIAITSLKEVIKNDLVYIFAGGELPTQFLSKIGISVTKKFGEAVLKHD